MHVGLQVLERSIAELQQKLNTNPDNPQVGVVRLSGLVHTDDRAAFQEIARQLCMCAQSLPHALTCIRV